MLFAEQTKLVFIDDSEFDEDPSAEIYSARLVVAADRHPEKAGLIPVDALFILPPWRIAWTDAAVVWDGKVDMARIFGGIIVWWGRHSKYLQMKLIVFV